MIELLKNKLYSTSGFQELRSSVDKAVPLSVDGLNGSLRAFMLSHLVDEGKRPVVFLTSDPDSAEKMHDDLEVLLKPEQVVFFPSTERAPYDDHDPNPSLVKLRLETLQFLINGGTGVVVCPLRGLMARVPSPERFVDDHYLLKKKSTLPFQSLIRNLKQIGFERTDIVEDVGHYAVRGGIIDIFPWTKSDPVRVEFFGDTIESIRTFNVISQRSIEEVEEIELLPALNSESNVDSIFNYLSKETVFVIEERKMLEEKAKIYQEEIYKIYQDMIAENIYQENPDQRYLLWDQISGDLVKYPDIYFSLISAQSSKKIHFKSTTPPTFAGHLNRLFSYLRKSKHAGIFTLIQCDTRTQSERLEEILTDEGLDTAANMSIGSLHEGFVCPESALQVLTDHEIFDRYKKRRTYQRFKNGEYLRSLSALNLNDYVVHIQHGIGRYMGLETIESSGSKRECIKLQYAEGDLLFVSVDRLNSVQKYASEEESIPGLTHLGSGEWERIKKRTKASIEKMATELIEMQAARKAQSGYAFSEDTHWQRELEASFPYDETEDQLTSIDEVKKDLQSAESMDRLLCGDVGYGKTEVAIRAAFKVVMEGKQVVILVPTTILAYQHFQTFKERMSEFPVHIEMLSRFRTAHEQKKVIEKLATGEADIIIGTHRLLSDDVKIKDLGLLIIDEEQRFGVRHKEKLKNLRITVDVLTMTATPIPRTLHLSLMGARDLSNIETPPRNRLPVITEIHEWDDDLIRQAIIRELARKGQVYFVHNRVKTIDSLKNIINEIVPGTRTVVAHGQLPERQLESIMFDFIHKKHDILISTMIIENGLDIPNVNTIIIDHADKFGLSQLYQLRGRVGRSDVQAYAYLLVPPVSRLTSLAQKRLRAIQDFTDLGSGLKIALRDMEIRGIGNILGKEQSGNIQAVGFDLYVRMIDESVYKLKEKSTDEVSEKFMRFTDTKIDVDFDLMIPLEYISTESERVSFYQRLVNYQQAEDLEKIKEELKDRFGPIPSSVLRIIDAIELKILAGRIYAAHIRLRENKLTVKFSDEIRTNKVFQEKIVPAILKLKQTEVKFSGDQSNPLIHFSLPSESGEDRINKAKIILQNIG
jgi:transcription-repair coupling factor (superfamily II helicase)